MMQKALRRPVWLLISFFLGSALALVEIALAGCTLSLRPAQAPDEISPLPAWLEASVIQYLPFVALPPQPRQPLIGLGSSLRLSATLSLNQLQIIPVDDTWIRVVESIDSLTFETITGTIRLALARRVSDPSNPELPGGDSQWVLLSPNGQDVDIRTWQLLGEPTEAEGGRYLIEVSNLPIQEVIPVTAGTVFTQSLKIISEVTNNSHLWVDEMLIEQRITGGSDRWILFMLIPGIENIPAGIDNWEKMCSYYGGYCGDANPAQWCGWCYWNNYSK